MLRIPLGSRVFVPRLLPTLVVLPALAGLVSLGEWQLGRSAEKRVQDAAFARGGDAPVALPANPDAAARYTHVRVRGHYLADRQFLLDNSTQDGVAGYRVLTPLEGEGGLVLLVDRGWVPGGASRAQLPDVAVAVSEREVTGRLDLPPEAGIRLEAAAEAGWPRRVSFPHLDALGAALGRPVYPRLLLLDAAVPDGYVRAWKPGGLTPERHLGYAVQWFGLALTLLIGFVVIQLEKPGTPP